MAKSKLNEIADAASNWMQDAQAKKLQKGKKKVDDQQGNEPEAEDEGRDSAAAFDASNPPGAALPKKAPMKKKMPENK